MKKVTMQDVADKARVSLSTVSLILNGSDKFPEQTCKKVIDACGEIGYSFGKKLFKDAIDDKVLIVVVPTLSNHYFVKNVGAMQYRAKELGYSVLVFETKRSRTLEARIINICINYPCAGVIFCYPPENNMQLPRLEASKPVIHIYDKGVYSTESNLAIDGMRVGRVIGEHLLSLGHIKIVYLCLDFEKKQVLRVRRLEGLRSTYREAGYDGEKSVQVFTPQIIMPDNLRTLDGYDLGYRLTERLLLQNREFTAIVGLNDMVAIGAMDALIDAGKSIPEDYSVCGCDNTTASQYRSISLTTVESYSVRLGRDAVDILDRKLQKDNLSEYSEEELDATTHIEYLPKLIVRKSTDICRR